jgi:hypothetical protein
MRQILLLQMDELVEVIPENGQVSELNLRNCSLTPERLQRLAAALAQTPASDLKVLNLNCGNLSADAMDTVLQIVRGKPKLEVLM